MTQSITEPAPAFPALDGLDCVTGDPNEPAGLAYLLVCDHHVVDIVKSVRCPPECGGHPICAPCLALARQRGLVKDGIR
jgi:hypothetical protein